MKKMSGDTRGISVIVGAMMLTLIVVTAATSYAIFLDDQQKKIQASESLRLQREIENLNILALENPKYTSNPGLVNVSFVITNLNAQETTITSVNINNRFVKIFTIQRLSSVEEWNISSGKYLIGCLYANGTDPSKSYRFFDKNNNHQYDKAEEILSADKSVIPIENERGGLLAKNNTNRYFVFQDLNNNMAYDASEPIIHSNPFSQGNATIDINTPGFRDFLPTSKKPTIQPREQVTIHLYDIENTTIGMKGKTIAENEAITVNIFTTLTNVFSKTFYPPTAIIKIITESQWDPTVPGFVDFLILDGASSDHPGDAYIQSWKWTVEDLPLPPVSIDSITGRKIRAPARLTDGNSYQITLTVTDNFGMTGSNTITYP